MKDRRVVRLVSIILICTTLVGCHGVGEPLHYLGEATLDHYVDRATQIDYSNVDQPTDDEVKLGQPPRRVRHPRKDDIWDLTLTEALHLALNSSQVSIIRSGNQFLSPFNPVLVNPNAANSPWDPAIQGTGILFGQRGVEAALADFDTNFTTSMMWGRNEEVLNTGLFGLSVGQERIDETANFSAQMQKVFADGSLLTASHVWDYELNNLTQLFPSSYTGRLEFEYRRPMLAGSGTEFTRIAAPIGRNLRGVSGVGQGVTIARINNDIAIADFEASVRNLLKDVEDTYWDLYLAYRTYDSEVVARDSARRTWEGVKARNVHGLEGGSAADEAQARDNYFGNRVRAENALADIFAFETRLRRLLGLTVNDGKVIRPDDEPTTAEFLPDWHISLAEALTCRVELRKQKWNIKSLELQLTAAKSLTRPRLDLVTRYRINAFGDDLFSSSDDDGITTQGLASGYGTLFQGSQTGWGLGIECNIPIGFRQAYSQVRNYELRLAKGRAALGAMELEISHELSNAFQSIDRAYLTAQTNFNRRAAAAERVKATESQFRTGQASVDLLLRAQVSLAASEVAYYQSVIQYNKAIADVHFRKGTLLAMNNVHLQEGAWEPEAYDEALRRAWARSHAYNAKSMHAEPAEFVVPWDTASEPLMPADQPLIHLYDEPGQAIPPAPAEPAEPAEPADQAPDETTAPTDGADDNPFKQKPATTAPTTPIKHPGETPDSFAPDGPSNDDAEDAAEMGIRPIPDDDEPATLVPQPMEPDSAEPAGKASLSDSLDQ